MYVCMYVCLYVNNVYVYYGTLLTEIGMKDMFYLMTYSTHFILPLYGVGHMVDEILDA